MLNNRHTWKHFAASDNLTTLCMSEAGLWLEQVPKDWKQGKLETTGLAIVLSAQGQGILMKDYIKSRIFKASLTRSNSI